MHRKSKPHAVACMISKIYHHINIIMSPNMDLMIAGGVHVTLSKLLLAQRLRFMSAKKSSCQESPTVTKWKLSRDGFRVTSMTDVTDTIARGIMIGSRAYTMCITCDSLQQPSSEAPITAAAALT